MQIDVTTALSALSTVVAVATAIIMFLGRLAIGNRERDIDRRLSDTSRVVDQVDTRLHAEEKATIRQDGELALVKQNHTGLDSDLREIKLTMVTKVEWLQLEKTIERLITKSTSRPGFPSPYSQQGDDKKEPGR